MAAFPRGRGFAASLSKKQELRRPGEPSLKSQRESGSLPSVIPQKNTPKEVNLETLCEKIVKMNLSSDPKEALSPCANDIKSFCKSTEDLEKLIESLFQYALKSKWNAHAIALFSFYYGDITVNQVKFRMTLLRRLQGLYMERNKSYLNLETFLLEATFACEIFYHVRIDGECIQILVHPIVDYLSMLLDGASQKEVEIFAEQFPKCFKDIKRNDHNGLDILISKIRKQIVAETTTITVKAMLLQMFELILTDFKTLNETAKVLYESLSKPIVRICN